MKRKISWGMKLVLLSLVLTIFINVIQFSMAINPQVDSNTAIKNAQSVWQKAQSPTIARGVSILVESNNTESADVYLVYSIEKDPLYYIVPILENGKIRGLVGINSKTGDWEWYTKVELNQFPNISEDSAKALAYNIDSNFQNNDPIIVSLNDTRLYWLFTSEDNKILYIDIDAGNISSESEMKKHLVEVPVLKEEPAKVNLDAKQLIVPNNNLKAMGSNPLPSSYNLSVPFYYQETPMYCGQAVLKMIFGYLGNVTSQADIAKVSNNAGGGTYSTDLARAARFSNISTAILDNNLQGYPEWSRGYEACQNYWMESLDNYAYRYTDIKRIIYAGKPLVVVNWYDSGHVSTHFRVVTGYDDNLNVFIVNDPWYSAPYYGSNISFNQVFFVDNLWNVNSVRDGFIVEPVPINLTSQYNPVAKTITLSAYLNKECSIQPSNSQFNNWNAGWGWFSGGEAWARLPDGFSLASGESIRKNLSSPSYSFANWTINVPEVEGNYNFSITAEPSIRGYSTSFPYSSGYTDILTGSNMATFYIDTINPLVSINYPINIENYTTNVSQLNYVVSDTNLASCWYSTNNGTINSSIDLTCSNFTGITSFEGYNNWTVYTNDSFGNLNSSYIQFFKDSISPLISYSTQTPANNSYLSQSFLYVNVTAIDTNLANITFNLYNSTSLVNSTTYSSQQFINWTNLSNTIYYVNVTATDILNNQNSTTTRTISLDTTIPQIDFAYNQTINNTYQNTNNLFIDLSLSGTNIANITFYLFSNTDTMTLVNTTTLTNPSATINNSINFTLARDAIYYYNATICNSVGVCNSSATQTFIRDTTYPQLNLIYPANDASSTDTSWTFNYNVTETNLKNCSLFLDGILVNFNISANSTGGTNSFAETSISIGKHNWSINCIDFADNLNASATENFTINAPVSLPNPNSGNGGGGGGGGGSPIKKVANTTYNEATQLSTSNETENQLNNSTVSSLNSTNETTGFSNYFTGASVGTILKRNSIAYSVGFIIIIGILFFVIRFFILERGLWRGLIAYRVVKD